MIQDIEPKKLYNHYDPEKKPTKESYIYHFRGDKVLLRDEEDVVFPPRLRDFAASAKNGLRYTDHHALTGEEPLSEVLGKLIYLFSVDDEDFFWATAEDVPCPEGYTYTSTKFLRQSGLSPRYQIFSVYTGHQLVRWYKDNVFCGTCGSRTEHSKKERAVVCSSCGRTIYPRILPAVIVGVTNGDKLLMTKYADRPLATYALVAGFTEIGETVEQTVAREVMEEVGLKVKNIRYYKSQPWGVADDMLMGFYCDVDGDDTIRLDHQELKEGKWFERAEIEGQPTDYALTNEMMLAFRDGKQ